MNTNKEIFNYLNLVDRRLGQLYKRSGFNPLPDDFSFDKEAIKERLYLNQMPSTISFPDFLYEEKSDLKKRFKLTIKRIDKILKEEEYKKHMSKDFAKKFELYLVMRKEVTSLILKDFSNFDFDECDAYTEICQINTIFFDLLETIFDSEFDFSSILDHLEDEYNLYYTERLKRLEEKKNKKISEKTAKIGEKIQRNIKNNSKINKNNLKIEEKIEKNQKIEEIAKIKAKKKSVKEK